mgnify:CR=1 FL=1|jgi:hypothetical protein
MSEALLFLSQFFTVLLLVIQSQNNVHGHKVLGAVTSVGIGIAQIATFKLLPSADVSEMIAWVAAGPAANVAAQWIKRHDIAKIRRLH